MARHRLDPAPETTVNVYSPGHAPVLTVDPAARRGGRRHSRWRATARTCGSPKVTNVTWRVPALLPAGLLS